MSARAGSETSAGSSTPPSDVVVVTNDRREVFQRSVIGGVEEVVRQRGFGLRVVELPDPPSDDAAAALRDQAAGLLILANVLSDAALAEVAATGLPVTLVSHRPQSVDLPTVMHDNAQGMELLMRHLVVDLGRRHLAFIAGDAAQTDAREREEAFRRELLRHDLEVPDERFLRGDFVPSRARAALAKLVPGTPDLDAVVAADYLMAIAARQMLRGDGRRAPRDVVVVGFGDGPEAETAGLTTVAADVVELGRRSARQLLGQIEHGPVRGLTLLSTELVRRDGPRRRPPPLRHRVG